MPRDLELLTDILHRRQLTTPLLLMLASHRPLAFVAGQFLYVLAPLGLLLGWENVNNWAALLSEPDAMQHLPNTLAASSTAPQADSHGLNKAE